MSKLLIDSLTSTLIIEFLTWFCPQPITFLVTFLYLLAATNV